MPRVLSGLMRALDIPAQADASVHRDIGVSNFTVAHLGQLVSSQDVKIRPSVNQVDRGILEQNWFGMNLPAG